MQAWLTVFARSVASDNRGRLCEEPAQPATKQSPKNGREAISSLFYRRPRVMIEIVKRAYDVSAKNPRRKEKIEHLLPEEIVAGVLEKQREITSILEELQQMLRRNGGIA